MRNQKVASFLPTLRHKRIDKIGLGSSSFQSVWRLALGLVAPFCLSGCDKQRGEAVVVRKEHIAAAVPNSDRPPSASPTESRSDEELRPIRADEIMVDGYVMKPDARGTGHDPRA